MKMATNYGVSPLYLEIGKALALNLAAQYASTNPGVSAGLAVVNSIMQAQAAVVAHNAINVKAQAEGWADTDPRWDAPLAEQQARMDVVNKRLDDLE
jgi:hypothetical protein